ncbi:MAG: PKD domain-containing protein [Lewinellaceae bacterium]|nr:PKD domain-containing protein [Lewinellaceae bacterium]
MFIFCIFHFIDDGCNLEKIEEVPSVTTANFTFSNDGCQAPCSVTFTNTSTNAASFSWNFGDGSPVSTVTSPMHTFTTGGTFDVSLQVTSASNVKDTITKQVTIADAPIEFSVTLGAAGNDETGRAVLQISDGYLVLAENSDCPSNKCLEIYKLDKNGAQTWKKSYAYSTFYNIYPKCLLEIPSNGGFVIGGYTQNGAEIDAMAMKIDPSGNISWQQKFGASSKAQYFYDVCPSSDGGYVFTGSYQDASNNNDVYVLKTNSTGDKVWEQTLNYPGPGTGIAPVGNGYLVLSGHPYEKIRLLSLNSTGGVSSTVQVGDDMSNVSNDLIATSDGGYLITGERGFDQYTEIYLIKVNAALSKQWDLTLADMGWFEAGIALCEQADGSFAVAATRDLNVVILSKINANGTQGFYKELGNGDVYGIDACTDGGYVLTGSDGSGGLFVHKTDKDGNL